MYPMIKPAMDRLNQEKVSLKGTPLATTMTFEGVKSKAQVEEQSKSSGGGGLSGMLARKMAKKDDRPRATIFTMSSETLEIATAVARARRRHSGGVQAEVTQATDSTESAWTMSLRTDRSRQLT